MASSVSGSSTVNGLYSNANQISGLVSGLDTESMIESLVDSYNMKIISYQRDIVMQQWKQEAYRDVITDLQNFKASFNSYTNLANNISSNSFWNNATTTVATGSNSDAVSVSGSSDVPITIDSVVQVATSTRAVSSALASTNDLTTATGEEVDLNSDAKTTVGTLEGTMKITYNASTASITFDDTDVIDTQNGTLTQAEALANLINEKLSTAYLGSDVASTKMQAVADGDGNISFVDLEGNGTSPYIKSCTSDLAETLGVETSYSSYSPAAASFNVSESAVLTEKVSNSSLVEGTKIGVNYNGSTVYLTVPDEADTPTGENYADYIVTSLNEQLESKFGGVVTVSNGASGGSLQLEFDISDGVGSGNYLKVTAEAGEYLGIDSDGLTTYIASTDTLESVFGEGEVGDSLTVDQAKALADTLADDNQGFIAAVGTFTYNQYTNSYTDSDGDSVTNIGTDDEPNWVKLDDDGKVRVGEEMIVNGVSVGFFDGSNTIEDVMTAINNSSAGVSVTFSTLTNNFVFSSDNTGSNGTIEFEGSLAESMFGTEGDTLKTTAGQDAVMVATVNGEQITLVRSSNSFEIEGLTVTAKSTFNNTDADGNAISVTGDDGSVDLSEIGNIEPGESISFEVETDFDPIIDVIKEMVDSYNELVNKVKTYFTEVPLTSTDGSSYKPLTDDDANSMTESAVETYEANAKTGLLYGDTNMRALYTSLSSVFSASGSYGIDLYNMGFSTSYGQTSTGDMVDLDTDKLREMLETDFDKVKTAFTATTSANGANGVMANLDSVIEQYASVTGATKGILVNEAGSELSALSLLSNSMQDKIESFQNLIAEWEERLSNKVTFYTAQFTKLEVLMSQANSQSSALAGLGSSY